MPNLISFPDIPNSISMSNTFLIEADQPFAQSALWEIQKNYFEIAGPEAWAQGVVPHYITSNPHIARSYADLIIAFFRDQERLGRTGQKVRILELGAGSGKLAYNLLRSLDQLCADAPFPIPEFSYILTDLPRSNIEFWKTHPRFAPYLDQGRLDIAILDALDPNDIFLENSQQYLKPLLEEGPLIVVANYFFDSIPQALFRIRGNRLEACHTTLHSTNHPDSSFPAEVLAGLSIDYNYHEHNGPVYNDKEVDNLLQSYAGKFKNSHLLFPHIGLHLLQTLLEHAPHGLVMLSSDKGEHRIEDLQGRGAPRVQKHGSFSLQVNYHAIREMCRKRGGIPLSSNQMHFDIVMHCMLFHPQSSELKEVQHTFRHTTNSFSPDNFFGVKKSLEKAIPEMKFREITAALQLSRNDPRLFIQLLPRLFQLAPKLTKREALTILQVSIRVWENYFPLGEPMDLANSIGELLKKIGFKQEGDHFLQISRQLKRGRPEA